MAWLERALTTRVLLSLSPGHLTRAFALWHLHKAYDCGDANHISERLSSLKNEMSELRVTNALYCNRKGYTALEKSASALRRDRLVEIKLELADPMKRCA